MKVNNSRDEYNRLFQPKRAVLSQSRLMTVCSGQNAEDVAMTSTTLLLLLLLLLCGHHARTDTWCIDLFTALPSPRRPLARYEKKFEGRGRNTVWGTALVRRIGRYGKGGRVYSTRLKSTTSDISFLLLPGISKTAQHILCSPCCQQTANSN